MCCADRRHPIPVQRTPPAARIRVSSSVQLTTTRSLPPLAEGANERDDADDDQDRPTIGIRLSDVSVHGYGNTAPNSISANTAPKMTMLIVAVRLLHHVSVHRGAFLDITDSPHATEVAV